MTQDPTRPTGQSALGTPATIDRDAPAEDAARREGTPDGPRVDVLGVGISITSMPRAMASIADWIATKQRQYVCVTPVHGVMESQRDPDLMRIHNESGLTVPDGMPMVWAGKLAGATEIGRVYGPELMEAVCDLAAHRGWRTFLYGGAPGVPERLADRLRRRFPGLQVVGTYSPPYRPLTSEEDAEIVDRINSSGAELVWVGVSTPKQERWMAEHVNRLASPAVLIGVGAAFDVHAGLKRRPPGWLGPLGLFWLYRLLQEPRRLWRRYLVDNPRFVASIVRRPPALRDRDLPADGKGAAPHGRHPYP